MRIHILSKALRAGSTRVEIGEEEDKLFVGIAYNKWEKPLGRINKVFFGLLPKSRKIKISLPEGRGEREIFIYPIVYDVYMTLPTESELERNLFPSTIIEEDMEEEAWEEEGEKEEYTGEEEYEEYREEETYLHPHEELKELEEEGIIRRPEVSEKEESIAPVQPPSREELINRLLQRLEKVLRLWQQEIQTKYSTIEIDDIYYPMIYKVIPPDAHNITGIGLAAITKEGKLAEDRVRVRTSFLAEVLSDQETDIGEIQEKLPIGDLRNSLQEYLSAYGFSPSQVGIYRRTEQRVRALDEKENNISEVFIGFSADPTEAGIFRFNDIGMKLTISETTRIFGYGYPAIIRSSEFEIEDFQKLKEGLRRIFTQATLHPLPLLGEEKEIYVKQEIEDKIKRGEFIVTPMPPL